MGFLDRFRESGASIVVTTHFDRLKVYGYLHPDVENVAVDFDEETMEPKYTLSYGAAGLSNAFLVAGKLGISEDVLEIARHHQDGGGQEIARSLETLERLKAETEKQRLQLLKSKEEMELQRQRLKALLEEMKRRKQEIFLQAEEKANRAIQKLEEELKEWVRRQKEEKAHLKTSPLKIHRKDQGENSIADQKEGELHDAGWLKGGRPC
jgi:DNA mismatch repair protein MutS2